MHNWLENEDHLDSAFDKETFETTNAGIDERLQVRLRDVNCTDSRGEISTHLVSRDDPAPEGNVSPALSAGRGALRFQILDSGRWWDGVEGHVHDGRDPTRGCGAGTGPEPLPVGPSRFVEMHMRAGSKRISMISVCTTEVGALDQTGEHDVVTCINPVAFRDAGFGEIVRRCMAGQDISDFTRQGVDDDGGGLWLFLPGQQYLSSGKDLRIVGHGAIG